MSAENFLKTFLKAFLIYSVIRLKNWLVLVECTCMGGLTTQLAQRFNIKHDHTDHIQVLFLISAVNLHQKKLK